MTSPLSGATLTAQRAAGRWKKYYAAIVQPNTIFSARINQTFTSLDGVVQITYDGGSGTYTNVKAGMSCWIGSSAGAYDIGIVRVRKALSTTKAFIGKVSGIQFANDQYLTFVDDFGLWSKEPRIADTTVLMDDDVVWSAALAGSPIVRIGPPARVLKLTGATVSTTWTAPTIYSPTGATISSYAWTAPGASATANLTTSTPTFTYNAAGDYSIYCAITDSNSIVTTVTRKVLVNPTSVPVCVEGPSGDIDSGGWSAHIEGFSGVTSSTLRDRAMVVLWKEDFVGTASDTSYGPYTGGENLRLIGWVDGESISQNSEFGTFECDIHGPAYWLDKLPGFPVTITDATATGWNTIATLNTDKALHRLIKWQSTLTEITDVTFTGDTTRLKVANINTGSLRQQIDTLAGEKLLARMTCDRFGCVRVSIPPSLLDSTGKNALTILWDTDSTDWAEEVQIERVTSAQTAMTEIGGTGYDGSAEIEYWSRAPGNAAGHYGAVQAPYSSLALNSQTVANRLSGDVLAADNTEYPTVDVVLYWANDFADISPGYIVRLTLAAADTPRGIAWSNKRFYIQSVAYEFDAETGAESTLLTLAEETTGNNGVTYTPPKPEDPSFPDPPPFPEFPLVPPPSDWFPPIIPPPPPGSGCAVDAPENAFALVFDPGTLADGESATAYFPCMLRDSTHDNAPSYIKVFINFDESAANNIDCYALGSGGDILLAGVVTQPSWGDHYTPTIVAFYPASDLNVWGFKITAHCSPRSNETLTVNTQPPVDFDPYLGDNTGAGSIVIVGSSPGSISYAWSGWQNKVNGYPCALHIHGYYTVAAGVHLWMRMSMTTTDSASENEIKGAPWAPPSFTGYTWTGSGFFEGDINPTGGAYTNGSVWMSLYEKTMHVTDTYIGYLTLTAYSGTPDPTYIYISNPAWIYDVCPNSET